MRPSTSSAGTTLLEVIVAILVVGMVFTSGFAAAAADLRATESGSRSLVAAMLAADVLASLAILDQEELAAIAGTGGTGEFDPPYERYSWVVVPPRHPLPIGLIGGEVVVRWERGSHQLPFRFCRCGTVVPAP